MSPWQRLLTDAALVARARRDDAPAFEELVRRYQRVALATAAAVGVPRSNRDDVVQESFLRAFRGLPRMEQDQKFGAWLRQIVRRESLRSLERSRRDEIVNDIDVAERERPDRVEGAELRDRVLSAVQSLPLELREAIFAYYYEGLSTRLAARSAGVSISSLKHRLQRSRELLRVRLGRELAEDLGIPPTGRALWDRRARSLSLLVIAASPALRPSSAPGAVAASGVGLEAMVSPSWLFPLVQAGIMSTKNIALGLAAGLSIVGAVVIWWLASGGPQDPGAVLRGEGGRSTEVVDANEAGGPRVAATGGPSDGMSAAEKAASAELQRRDAPSLEGRVLDTRGQPVPEARVVPLSSGVLSQAMLSSKDVEGDIDPFTQIRVLRQEIRGRLAESRAAVTDEAGRYTVPSLGPGEYRVLVVHPAFLPLTDAWVDITSSGTATRDVTLEDGERIRGRVSSLDGAPLAGAAVTIERAERRGAKGVGSAMVLALELTSGADLLELGAAKTDRAGEFEVGSLEPAVYDVRAVHEGYLAGTLENVETGSAVDLRLSPARALRGRVTDSTGKPMARATATLRAPRHRAVTDEGNPVDFLAADVDLRDARTRSKPCSEDGTFVLYPPRADLYEVVLSAPGFLEAKRLERLGERETSLGNVRLESGQVLRGVVLSATGAPANARVSARLSRAENAPRPGAEALAETMTREGGRFELGPLPDEDLVVTAVDETIGSVTVEHRSHDVVELELRIPTGEVIEGIVVDASSEQPIGGAIVTWSDTPTRRTTSAEDGNFRFAGVPEDFETRYGGHLVVVVRHPHYSNALSREKWARGQPVRIALEPQPLVHGVVVDGSGSPAAGARVAIEVPGLPQDFLILAGENSAPGGAFSNAEGRFELRVGLAVSPETAIDIVATHPALGRGRARMTSGNEEDLRIELMPAARVEVTVRDASGSVVKGARVSLERSATLPAEIALFKELLPGMASATGFSDENGRAILRGVEPGTYDLVAIAQGFGSRRHVDYEVGRGTAAIDVVLERGRDLSGRVVDELLAPVSGADVVVFDLERAPRAREGGRPEDEKQMAELVDAAGRGSAAATSDREGRFSLSGLAPGTYRLVVRGEGILPAHIEPVEPGRQLQDIRVERCAALAVRVREAGSGAPIASFQITVTEQTTSSDAARFAEEVSNAEGKFERVRLPAGTIGIGVRAAGYAPWSGFTTLAGGSRREVEATLFPARRVEGLVRSARTGAPIPEAAVFLISGPPTKPDLAAPGAEEVDDRWFRTEMVMTDAAGRFVIGDARDGELRIHVRHAEYYDPKAGSRAAIVAGGAAMEVDPVELLPGATIQVAVEGLDSLAAPDIFFAVEVAPATPDENGAGASAVRETPGSISTGLNAEGQCVFSGIAPGVYAVRLLVLRATPGGPPVFDGEPRALGTVTVGAGETAAFTGRL